MRAVTVLVLLLVLAPLAAILTAAELQPLSSFPNPSWADGVVVVICGNSYGTGWWVSDLHVVTAAHVVGSYDSCTVLRGGVESKASVIASNQSLDAAVLAVSDPSKFSNKHVFRLRPDGPTIGEDAYVIGYPAELLQIYGSVSEMSTNPRIFYFKVPWYDGSIGLLEIGYTDKGNSGGPVVDSNGNAIGLVSFALKTGVQYLFFATSSEKLVVWLQDNNIDVDEAEPVDISDSSVETMLTATAGSVALAASLVAVGAAAAWVYMSRRQG